MKKSILVFVSALFLMTTPAWTAETKQIDIKDYKFVPASITIAAGDTVTWINHDDVPHTIAEKGKQFRSTALDTNDHYAFTFAKPGAYSYFCTLHPTMVGTIIVAEAKK